MTNVKSSAMSPKVWHCVTPCCDDDIVVRGSRWRNLSDSTHPHTTTDIDVLSIHLNSDPMPTHPNNAMTSHLTKIKQIKAGEVPVCVEVIYVYVFLMWINVCSITFLSLDPGTGWKLDWPLQGHKGKVYAEYIVCWNDHLL